MFNKLDHLIVAVKDLQEAENNYQKLFGMAPVWSGTHKELGTSNSLFNFQNTYFELLAPTCLLYTSPSPRDATLSRMPSSA